MYIRLTLASLTILITLGGTAKADLLAGGPVYGGGPIDGAKIVTCRLFNYGTTVARITKRQIFDNTGAVLALQGDSCNVLLRPTKTCHFYGISYGNLAFSCRMDIGTNSNISGVAEVLTSDLVIHTVPLQW